MNENPILPQGRVERGEPALLDLCVSAEMITEQFAVGGERRGKIGHCYTLNLDRRDRQVGGESPIDKHQRTAARNRLEKTSHILRGRRGCRERGQREAP